MKSTATVIQTSKKQTKTKTWQAWWSVANAGGGSTNVPKKISLLTFAGCAVPVSQCLGRARRLSTDDVVVVLNPPTPPGSTRGAYRCTQCHRDKEREREGREETERNREAQGEKQRVNAWLRFAAITVKTKMQLF